MPYTIIHNDVRKGLGQLPDEHFHCIITSPPYYLLRGYGTTPQVWGGDVDCVHRWQVNEPLFADSRRTGFTGKHDYIPDAKILANNQGATCIWCKAWVGELGNEPTVELYIQHIVEICNLAKRKLRQDGTFWLNLGFTYHGLWNSKRNEGGAGVLDNERSRNRNVQPGYKPKDIILVPYLVADALQKSGWYLRVPIIWHKPNALPSPQEDRPTLDYEPVLLLAKSGNPLYWVHPTQRGQRTLPKPDYRWRDKANNNQETDVEPDHWRTELLPGASLSDDQVAPRADQLRWQRVNLWTGRDYYYDAWAIREPLDPNSDVEYRKILRPTKTYDTKAPYRKNTPYARGSGATTPGDGKRTKRATWLLPDDLAVWRYLFSTTSIQFLPELEASFVAWVQQMELPPTVWSINTAYYDGAHFAVFPPDLIEPMILASTSIQCCKSCGAPYQRIVEKGEKPPEPTHRNPVKRLEPGQAGNGTMGFRASRLSGQEMNEWRLANPDRHKGWLPTCQCATREVAPCRVLDIFGGSGTTAAVALKLGRHGTIIELQDEYVALAKERLAAAQAEYDAKQSQPTLDLPVPPLEYTAENLRKLLNV